MSTQEFGHMVDQAMREQGMSLRRLGARIGMLPDGRVVDATMLKRVIEGQRRSVDTYFAWALIEELHLDPLEASEAAGVWPPNVTIDMIRQLDLAVVGAPSDQPKPNSGRFAGPRTSRRHPARRHLPERRRRDRRDRRGLYVVPQDERVDVPA